MCMLFIENGLSNCLGADLLLDNKKYQPVSLYASPDNTAQATNRYSLTISYVGPSPRNLAPLSSYHLPLKLDSGV